MKDFDAKRREREQLDRSFMIGGEKFVRKASVRPELLSQWSDLSASAGSSEVLEVVDELVHGMIEREPEDAHARWKALREREDDPLSLGDLTDLVEWLIQESTGQVPTQPDSPSSNGPAGIEPSSTDASSSPAAPVESGT